MSKFLVSRKVDFRRLDIQGYISEVDLHLNGREIVEEVRYQLVLAVVDHLMKKITPRLDEAIEAAIEAAFREPEEKIPVEAFVRKTVAELQVGERFQFVGARCATLGDTIHVVLASPFSAGSSAGLMVLKYTEIGNSLTRNREMLTTEIPGSDHVSVLVDPGK